MGTLNALAQASVSGNPAVSTPARAALLAIAKTGGMSDSDTGILLTSGKVEITPDELDLAHDFTTNLNMKIKSVVESKGSRIKLVDPMAAGSPFLGHELCTGNPYFNGIVVGDNAAFSFHPNYLGQEAYKQLFLSNIPHG